MGDIDIVRGGPLRLWRGSVIREWLDYNGHMTEHRYLQVFGESSDRLYELIGIDFAHARDGAFYTLETRIRHIAECGPGTGLETETELLAYDDKRLHLFHRLYDATGRLLATAEHLAIHVANSKACPAAPGMLKRILAIFDAQRMLPQPAGTGSILKQPLVNSRPAGSP